MTKREVIQKVLNHEQPPYVPWAFRFTIEACQIFQINVELDYM